MKKYIFIFIAINIYGMDNNSINIVDTSNNSEFSVSSSNSSVANIWDTKTGKLLKALKGHSDVIHILKISPNNQFIVTSSLDGITHIWDMSDKSGDLLYVFGSKSPVNSITISKDDLFIETNSVEEIRRWYLDTGHNYRIRKN